MLTVVSRKASTLSLNGVSAAQSDPVTVQMTIDGVLVNMELDTGAAVSVMSKTQFRQLFPSAVLKPTTVKLRTYTGALVRPQGVSSVNVQHGDHSAILPLYVVDHKGPPLLGREWLHAVRLEWAKIWNLNNITRSDTPTHISVKKRLDALLAKYQLLFKDELGTITEERAELFFKPDMKPRFLKARNVPGSFTWRRHKDQLLARTTDPDREASDQEGYEFLAFPPSVDPLHPPLLPPVVLPLRKRSRRRVQDATRLDRRPPDRYQAGV
ncbi:uncharacterized protein LOC125944203 [Dermacentor silvarum]|uniref:uncharacterized protein LOC125944203 n=1 Tax=Dermacentor silvarum TaxID=543639 RepID=UPI0021013FA6|nr:uncharacterized protein LOC125944203 [Dermacentor silvarum]